MIGQGLCTEEKSSFQDEPSSNIDAIFDPPPLKKKKKNDFVFVIVFITTIMTVT